MPKKKKHKKQPKKRISMLSIILAVATLLGTALAAVALLPRIIVDSSVPVDPNNPMSASFTIINSSVIPLENIRVALGIGQIVTGSKQIDPNFIPSFESRIARTNWNHRRLSVDERYTVTIGDIFQLGAGVNLSGADIAIVVTYNPWFIPINRDKVVRFVTKMQTDGRLYWYSRPLQ